MSCADASRRAWSDSCFVTPTSSSRTHPSSNRSSGAAIRRYRPRASSPSRMGSRRTRPTRPACPRDGSVVRLMHSGFLYGLRDPKKFLVALSQVLEEENGLRQRVALDLVGTIELPYSLDGLLDQLNLREITHVPGHVSHDRCIEY